MRTPVRIRSGTPASLSRTQWRRRISSPTENAARPPPPFVANERALQRVARQPLALRPRTVQRNPRVEVAIDSGQVWGSDGTFGSAPRENDGRRAPIQQKKESGSLAEQHLEGGSVRSDATIVRQCGDVWTIIIQTLKTTGCCPMSLGNQVRWGHKHTPNTYSVAAGCPDGSSARWDASGSDPIRACKTGVFETARCPDDIGPTGRMAERPKAAPC